MILYSLLDEARMNHELCGWFLFMLESLWCKWENERDQDPKDDLISSTAIPTSCRTSFESLLLMSKTFHFSPLASISIQTSKKYFIPGISMRSLHFHIFPPLPTTLPCHVQRRVPAVPHGVARLRGRLPAGPEEWLRIQHVARRHRVPRHLARQLSVGPRGVRSQWRSGRWRDGGWWVGMGMEMMRK